MTNPSELMARLKGSQAQTQTKQEAPVAPPFMQQQTPQAQHVVVAPEQQQTLTAPPLGLGQTRVTQQLQEIGDQQLVNPPRTPIGVPPEQPPAQETTAGKSECPHCKKDFIRLGGHIKKCPVRVAKVLAEQAVQQSPEFAAGVNKGAELAQAQQDQILQEQVTQTVIPTTEEPFLPETQPTLATDFVRNPYPTPTNQAEKEVNAWVASGLPSTLKLVLIIGALIQKADMGLKFVDFTDFISPICTQMMADQKVAYWNQLEFGKAGPMLSAYLDEHLKNLSSPLTIVVSDTTSAEYRACSGVLQRYASRIIRGIHG